MLSLRRRALGLSILIIATACGVPQTIPIRAAVCGARCGKKDTSRPPGDFTELACATRARLRAYDVLDDGMSLGALRSERCIDLSDPARFADLFAVTAGVPGAPPEGRGTETLLDHPAPGLIVVEIALLAPGATADCGTDGPIVALGRSAPFDAGVVPEAPTLVPLGCHELCAGMATRTGTLQFRGVLTNQPVSVPADCAIGDLFAREAIVSPGGICSTRSQAFARAVYQPYQPGMLREDPGGALELVGTFGIDPYQQGGCAAIQTHSGAIATYSCISDIETSTPPVYTLDEAGANAIIDYSVGQDGPPAGPMVVLFLDASGNPLADVTLNPPMTVPNAPINWTGLDAAFGLTPASTTNGILVVAHAVSGLYRPKLSGINQPEFWAAGAEPGSITVHRVVLQK